jgi:hypothetical protein
VYPMSEDKTLDAIGPDGVKQIYPTKLGGTEFYLNMKDPYIGGAHTSRRTVQFNISFGKGSKFSFTRHINKTHMTDGLVYFNTIGSPISYASGGSGKSVRLDVYPDGGKWNNKTTYYWQNNPGFLYSPHSIGSGEFTTFIRVHGDLHKHQAYAHKIGGRDEDEIRSLIEMVYPTASHDNIQMNYNYAQFPYVKVTPTHKIQKPPPICDDGRWTGLKTVHKIAADKSYSDWETWIDNTPFAATGVANNWVLAATYHDVGTSAYNHIPLTWQCQKDVCRVDGFENVDFTLISDRSIADIG